MLLRLTKTFSYGSFTSRKNTETEILVLEIITLFLEMAVIASIKHSRTS